MRAVFRIGPANAIAPNDKVGGIEHMQLDKIRTTEMANDGTTQLHDRRYEEISRTKVKRIGL
jgi:hypothetical protein